MPRQPQPEGRARMPAVGGDGDRRPQLPAAPVRSADDDASHDRITRLRIDERALDGHPPVELGAGRDCLLQ